MNATEERSGDNAAVGRSVGRNDIRDTSCGLHQRQSRLPGIRTRKIVGRARSLARSPGRGRRLNVPEEIADLWLRRGVIPFFINPQSTPTLRLFYIVPRFQRLIFPIVPWRVSRQPTLLLLLLRLLLLLVPRPPFRPPATLFAYLRPSFLYNPPATAVPFHPSPTHPAASSQSLPDHGPHCHWQTDLNSGIKSIRSNGTRYIQPDENSALKKKPIVASAERGDFCLRKNN